MNERAWIYDDYGMSVDTYHDAGLTPRTTACHRVLTDAYAPATREAAERIGLRPCRHCASKRRRPRSALDSAVKNPARSP